MWPRAVRLSEYLEAVPGLREQPARDIAEYQDRRWWAGDIPAHSSCGLTSTRDEPWLMMSKTQIPSAPPVPKDVAAYLRTRITDPEREPMFAADFDDEYAGLKMSAIYTVANAVDDWAAWALDRLADKTVRSHVDLLRPVMILIGNIP
jgi:hypothetical protein